MQHINQPISILKSLRAVMPSRACTFDEAMVIAEHQASRLLALISKQDRRSDGIGVHHFNAMPRLRVVYEELPVSGMSYWNGEAWIIVINKHDCIERQRFTLLHEYKHVIDHGSTHLLYVGDRKNTDEEQAEMAADYFAGCALVSKARLKAAWGRGLQRITDLAAHFGVSEPAIEVRLRQTGLNRIDELPELRPASRCARPVRTSGYQPQRFVRAPSPFTRKRAYA